MNIRTPLLLMKNCLRNSLYPIVSLILLTVVPFFAQGLKNGDNIKVSISGHPELNRIYRVDENGILNISGIGFLPVFGMDMANLHLLLTEHYRETYPNSIVTIEITDEYEISFEVYGAVKNPGIFRGTNKLLLQSALIMAGIDEDSELNRVLLFRQNEQSSYDIYRFLSESDQTQNPQLKDRDRIVIPLKTNQSRVQLFGEVNKAGFYPLTPNMNLLDAISQGGGFTKDANLKNIRIIRYYRSVPIETKVNLEQIINDNEFNQLPLMGAGDIVIVERKRYFWRNVWQGSLAVTQQFLMIISLIITFQNLKRL